MLTKGQNLQWHTLYQGRPLDELRQAKFRRKRKRKPNINTTKHFCFIWLHLVSVRPATTGYLQLLMSLLSLENILKCLSLSCVCVCVNWVHTISHSQLAWPSPICSPAPFWSPLLYTIMGTAGRLTDLSSELRTFTWSHHKTSTNDNISFCDEVGWTLVESNSGVWTVCFVLG